MAFEKWSITAWLSLGVLVTVAAILYVVGTGREGLEMALRATARTSVVLFSLAFSASSLFKLSRNPATTWLLKNRRYVGVSFAVSHFVHLGLIVAVATRYPEPFFAERGPTEFLGGGLAYAFIAAMTATSFDKTTRWLGQKRWKVLHTVGGYYILIVFAQRYILSAAGNAAYIPLAALTLAVFGVRLWRRFASD